MSIASLVEQPRHPVGDEAEHVAHIATGAHFGAAGFAVVVSKSEYGARTWLVAVHGTHLYHWKLQPCTDLPPDWRTQTKDGMYHPAADDDGAWLTRQSGRTWSTFVPDPQWDRPLPGRS